MHELLDVKSCLEGAHGRVLVVKHRQCLVQHARTGELWLTIPCLPYCAPELILTSEHIVMTMACEGRLRDVS